MNIAIVGRTGSGKTFTAKGLVESELGRGGRACIIDPTGVWWGLRLRADGEGAGFPVIIFGGSHADIPVEPGQGEAVADLVAGGRVPQSVIDVSEMSGAESTRFLTAFTERLYAGNRQPLLLVMDEADVMAPQNPLPEQRRLQGAVNKIVRRGRVKGFRPIMITQRPAVLDKSVLSQIDTLIAMRLTSPQDRKAIEDWVKGNADGEQARAVIDSLAGLPKGEGWFWAPADDVLERRQFPAITTYDSGRTPEPGDVVRDVEPLSQAGIDEIRLALAPAPTAAISGSTLAPAADLDAAERAGHDRGLAAAEKEHVTELQWLTRAICGIRLALADELETIERRIGARIRTTHDHRVPGSAESFDWSETSGVPAPDQPIEPVDGAALANPLPRARPAPRESRAGHSLNSAARKMLAVLDTNPPVRRSWTQVATLAGLRASGGHFNAGRKGLRDQGLVVEDGALVSIASPSDQAAAPVLDPGALVSVWRDLLSGAAPKLLEALYVAGGRARRDEIAVVLGMKPSGGHWNAGWKELRDNDIVRVDGQTAVLTDLFQPAESHR